MNRRSFSAHMYTWAGLNALSTLIAWSVFTVQPALANTEAADMFIQTLSTGVLSSIKNDALIQNGDVNKISKLVDTQIMPHVNFKRMTASAVGPAWRQATAPQKEKLEYEFKTLMVRTYAGALSQLKDLKVIVKPMRSNPDDKEVIVRTELKGSGEGIQLDYRLEKDNDTWKIFNLNVLGVWLVDTYRTQFAYEINRTGLDGLAQMLEQKNKSNASK